MNNTNNILEISSLGIYSSWCYHRPIRTLFDCGEGVAMNFKNEIYGIERIFISHGHADHIYGLPGLVGIRNSVRGDKLKPLDVYYPKNCWGMEDVIDFISKRHRNLSYPLNFIKIDENFKLKLSDVNSIEAFSMKHGEKVATLGYRLINKRNRLKPEFQGKNIPEILKSGTVSKTDLTEEYSAVEFAYCLDSCGFDHEKIRNCELAVMDSTFIDPKDRDDLTHFTLDEVVKICKNMNVKSTICAHISPRYSLEDVRNAFADLPSNFKYHFPKNSK